MITYIQAFISITLILFAGVCGIFSFRHLDKAARILAVLVFATCITELFAISSAIINHTNVVIYNLYSLVDFSLLIYYFITIDTFKNRRNAYLLWSTVLLGWVLNLIYLQPLSTLNTYFFLLEGFVAIGLSLLTYYRLLVGSSEILLLRFPHFWFVTSLLFYWTLTYMYWGLYEVMPLQLKDYLDFLNFSLVLANVFLYCGIGFTFLTYKRMKTSNG